MPSAGSSEPNTQAESSSSSESEKKKDEDIVDADFEVVDDEEKDKS